MEEKTIARSKEKLIEMFKTDKEFRKKLLKSNNNLNYEE